MAPSITMPQIVIRQKILKCDTIEFTKTFIIGNDVPSLIRPPVTLTALVSKFDFVADTAHSVLGVDASAITCF
jgi:hypothetical protein